MVAVLVVQVPVMDEVDMVPVLHGLVLFARMAMRMRLTGHTRDQFLGFGVRVAEVEHVFIDMPVVPMVKMAIVEIVDVPRVVDGLMAAALGVGVTVMRSVEHLVCERGSGKEGKRQRGAKQGSTHDCGLHKKRSRLLHSAIRL